MKLFLEVLIAVAVPPLGTVLCWGDIVRRRDMAPPLKGLWVVLCILPLVGPILYLGVGQGQFL